MFDWESVKRASQTQKKLRRWAIEIIMSRKKYNIEITR